MRRKGFTLIELLVVIAIIAILAAILFPVFARARENARKSSCQSNLKQIGLGILQYCQDFDEKMPMVASREVVPIASIIMDPPNSQCTNAAMNAWTAPAGPCHPGWIEGIYPYLKSSQIFRCPSMSYPYNGDTVGPNYSSYGMNRYLGLATPGTHALGASNIWSLDNPYALAAIQSVSSKVLVTEYGNVVGAGTGPYSGAFNQSIAYSRRANGGNYLPGTTPGNGYDEVGFNHLAFDGSLYWTINAPHGVGNVLFCDGHVKAQGAGLSTATLITSSTSSNPWLPNSDANGAVHASTWYPDVP